MLNSANAWRAQPPAAVLARLSPHYPIQYAWMPSMRGEALDLDSTLWYGMRSASQTNKLNIPPRSDLSLGSATGGVLPIVVNARGLAINFAADGTKSSSNPSFGTALISNSSWTIIVALTFRTLTGALISQRTGGSGWLLEVSSNNYQWYDDTNGANSFGVGPTVGVPTVVVLTRSNTTWTLYATGIAATALTISNAPAIASPLQVGAHSGTSGALDATVSLVAMGLGTANGAMARSLVVNPWQLFEPAPAPQIFLGPTAAAAFNAAWNAGANSLIHSGGAQVN